MNIYTLPTIYPVTCHTDHVGPGSTFVAIVGNKQDGTQYIKKALERGATTIVFAQDSPLSPELLEYISTVYPTDTLQINSVNDTRLALAQLSAQAHDNPAKKLKIIGVTGTKGKTSTAFLLHHILTVSGYATALISGVYNSIGDQKFPTHLTTPQPDYLHMFFAECVKKNIEYVVMEVAAQALSLHRVHGINYSGIVFTNFDHEHAEFYNSYDDYFNAKKILFTQLLNNNAPVIINNDDNKGSYMLQHPELINSSALYAYGITDQTQKNSHFWKAHIISSPEESLELDVTCAHFNNSTRISCPALYGNFNAYNLLGAVALAAQLGIDISKIAQALSSFAGVPGRLERHELPNGAIGIIDYAHTPSSFNAVLPLLRTLTDHLIVIFGPAGERDPYKRPIMGSIAATYGDTVIISSDNPRSEDMMTMINMVIPGVAQKDRHKLIIEPDREQAIRIAYTLSRPGTIIALLGKGPDEYQQIGSIKHYFSEKAIFRSL